MAADTTRPIVEVKDGKMTFPIDYKPKIGLKSGRVYELTAFFKIKPGHAEALRKATLAHAHSEGRTDTGAGIEIIGIHESRHVIFDNDTRFLFQTSFDTEWDPYIEDSVRLLGTKTWYEMFKHLEGVPEDLDGNNVPADFFKVVSNAGRVPALVYQRSYPNSVGEIRSALKLQEVFQKVLDHPDAAKALEHPALKALLDFAAD